METSSMSGLLPNVFHQAVPLAQLRVDPRFEALPPAHTLCLAGTACYRFVRQEDELWGRLHAGMLTTGYLPAALAFYEQGCVRRLGIGKARASHGQLLSAYQRLCEPPYEPPSNSHITAQAAAAHNARVAAAFNAVDHMGGVELVAVPTEQATEAEAEADQPAMQPHNSDGAAAHAMSAPISLSSKQRHKKQRQRSRRSVAAATAAAAQPPAVQHLLGEEREHLTEAMKAHKAKYLADLGIQAVRCSWGKVQEGASLLALADVFPASRVVEVGLCVLDPGELPPEWGFDPGSLPPLGASPDGLIRHAADTSAVGLAEHLAALGLSPQGISSSGAGDSTVTAGPGGLAGFIEEVVEVKNTCPFGVISRQHSGRSERFILSDRGPRAAVEPQWVPQLQMHMLCARTQSALLVSRSATRGLRVFRMPRDASYLRLMLGLVSRLWQDHALPRRPPPPDAFLSLPAHQELVKRTKELAAAAVIVYEGEGGVAAGSDRRLFLDGRMQR